MTKETEKLFGFVALCLLFLLILWMAHTRIKYLQKELDAYKNAPADTTTIIRHDTISIDNPILIEQYESENEKVAIEVRRLRKQLAEALNQPADTIHDTTEKLVFLPREYMVYKDTNYRAVVSGVDPRLDSIEVYKTTIINNITKYVPRKVKTFGTFVEGGVSVNARDNKEMMWSAGAGVMVKQKVGAALEWQHNIQTKQDFIGGRLIIQF